MGKYTDGTPNGWNIPYREQAPRVNNAATQEALANAFFAATGCKPTLTPEEWKARIEAERADKADKAHDSGRG